MSGFRVSTVEQAAERMVQLLKDADLRRRMGSAARESVRRNFLMSRLLEQYLDLFSAFEPRFLLRPQNNLPGNQIES